MGATASDGYWTTRRVLGGFTGAIVLGMYAFAWRTGHWPSGHPWSGITLGLIASQSFLPLRSKLGLVASVLAMLASVLWVLALPAFSAALSGSSEANDQQGVSAHEPAPGSVEAYATHALGEAAKVAAFCQPQGGPVGTGKVRVVYAQDGSVQSAEVLTQEFRDTVAGSCVRMAFLRAKIPAFSGPEPTFIKSFSISAE
jgi:hypothetical protein